jgi:hypothetical protein
MERKTRSNKKPTERVKSKDTKKGQEVQNFKNVCKSQGKVKIQEKSGKREKKGSISTLFCLIASWKT